MPICQYSFCKKNSFIPRCLFHSLQLLTPVYESFLVCFFLSFSFFPHLCLSFVVYTNEEISFQCWAVSQLAEKAPDISQRSAATVLRWRLTFVTTLIHIYCKELWRSVSIRQHYGQQCGGTFSAASVHWSVLCHYADFVGISLLWFVSLCQCFIV